MAKAASAPIANSEGVFSNAKYATYAWLLFAYNLLAVGWGVFVRAGLYGDGCGSNWPLCDGNSTPLNGPIARIIEMSHRITTGIIGPMALALVIWGFRAFPKGHLVRKFALGALFFTLLEGFIGWALVKFKLVVLSESPVRALVGSFHVLSTYVLVGCLVGCAVAASGIRPIKLKGQGVVGWLLGGGFVGLALLGGSGAISALGHQLRPTEDVLKAALDGATFWMVRVQPLHPLLSVTVALYLTLIAGLLQHLRPDPKVTMAAKWMIYILGAQMMVGVVNIWVKAPIVMQIIHLVMADVNWVSLVALSVFSLSEGIEPVETRPAPVEVETPTRLRGRDLVNAYVALTKPRVISLLLFTTLATMVIAKGEWPGWVLFIMVGIGGYFAAGAANAINMVIDRDIDLTMKRTSTRPTVTQSIPSRHALIFAFTLAILSFAILWGFANILSAVMAMSGLVFYVVIYTMMLKRRTWHNIVIGGAAGAFPPLVGWAAVTNSLPPLALYLFGIIFVWTPVHFWALALLIKDDYAAAGVPMLPVVKGDRVTVIQIGLYMVGTILMTFVPLLVPQVGWIYAGSAVVLNVLLVAKYVKLYQQVDRPRASALFHYSMLYLAVLFLMLAVDRSVIHALKG